MSFVTGIVVVPLPFTTSIVAPVKSAFSPYFVAFVGCVFTFMFVTVSVTVYVNVVVFVIPFSVYVIVAILVPSVAVLKFVNILLVTVIASGTPDALVTKIDNPGCNGSFTLYCDCAVPCIAICFMSFIISIG